MCSLPMILWALITQFTDFSHLRSNTMSRCRGISGSTGLKCTVTSTCNALLSAKEKERLGKCNRKMSSVSASGQLIKTLAIFPEKAGHMCNTPLDAITLVKVCNISHSFLSHRCVIRALRGVNHPVQ